MIAVLFYGFAALVLLGAVAMIWNERHTGLAAYAFVGSMVALGAVYVLLDAAFIASIHLVFYAGGLAIVLVLSGTILEPVRPPVRSNRRLGLNVMAAVIGIGVAAAGAELLQGAFTEAATLSPEFGSVRMVGRVLLTDHVLAFEFVSLLLLSAIVGLVVLARQEAD